MYEVQNGVKISVSASLGRACKMTVSPQHPLHVLHTHWSSIQPKGWAKHHISLIKWVVLGKSTAIPREDSHSVVGKLATQSICLMWNDCGDISALSPPPLLNCPTPLLMSNTSQWLYRTGQSQTNREGKV